MLNTKYRNFSKKNLVAIVEGMRVELIQMKKDFSDNPSDREKILVKQIEQILSKIHRALRTDTGNKCYETIELIDQFFTDNIR